MAMVKIEGEIMSRKNITGYEKETYGIVAIIIAFIFIWVFVIAGLNITFEIMKPAIMLDIIFIGTSLALVLMAYFIKSKGTIYWITSYTYKDAIKMTDEKRKRISTIFYHYMGGTNIIIILYLVVSMFLELVLR